MATISKDKHERLMNLESLIANRLYEICVAQGYVDSRDWSDAANAVIAETASRSPQGELARAPTIWESRLVAFA